MQPELLFDEISEAFSDSRVIRIESCHAGAIGLDGRKVREHQLRQLV